ncbi:GSCFA domain-containing protein, partial [bacterium]|nr:GSCFA domain-containing protein [bacterium]
FDNLMQTDYLLLTFGTAWIYKLAESGKVVANCHKVPSGKFQRERLQVAIIVETYNAIILELKKINPALKIVFTVSPVRHWKDGPTENNISKGILLQAIQEITLAHQALWAVFIKPVLLLAPVAPTSALFPTTT